MTLRFLLDTNVLSEALRPRPDPRVMEHLKNNERALCTTAIVWHELRYGAERLAPGARRDHLFKYLDEVVVRTLPLLPYDANAATWHASARVELERKGKTPPFVDGMIAAVAAVHGLTLVTNNLADYQHFTGL